MGPVIIYKEVVGDLSHKGQQLVTEGLGRSLAGCAKASSAGHR